MARLAKVSPMTVSRVLNDSGPVSTPTRRRVLRAVESLGYRPNAAARALRGRSRTIGVVTMEGAVDGPGSTLAGIEQDARDLGYTVSISILQHPTAESIAEAVDRLRSQSVAGIVVSAPHTGLDDHQVATSGTPIVAVEGMHGHTPVVAVDQHLGAVLATEHLLQLGHVRIAHLAAPADRFEAVEREAGWRSALAAAGREPGPVLRGDWSPRSGYELAGQLLDQPITAVFCANDLMAIGAIRRYVDAGRSVPADLSVVGFDDIAEAGYLSPSLTTVRYDFYELGRRTLQQLLLSMETRGDDHPGPQARTMMSPDLIVRESTGAPGPAHR